MIRYSFLHCNTTAGFSVLPESFWKKEKCISATRSGDFSILYNMYNFQALFLCNILSCVFNKKRVLYTQAGRVAAAGGTKNRLKGFYNV